MSVETIGVCDDTTWRERRGWRWQGLSKPKQRARCMRQEYIYVLEGAFVQDKIENSGLCPEFGGH